MVGEAGQACLSQTAFEYNVQGSGDHQTEKSFRSVQANVLATNSLHAARHHLHTSAKTKVSGDKSIGEYRDPGSARHKVQKLKFDLNSSS